MSKSGNRKNGASAARESAQSPGVLLFEVDRRKLRTMLGTDPGPSVVHRTGVMELDAASHNSVDDIRDIKLSVTTVASAATSKRVFVLDEAHMLSKAAGNALLKTLEEPPEHVHFVLATTEPYKLLDTIRSRTQRFDFHPVPVEELAGYLSSIADLESYKTEPSALIATPASAIVRRTSSALAEVKSVTSTCVTPAYRRSALPGGQHISSTH